MRAMTATRSEPAVATRWLLWAAVAGVLAGIAAKAADESGWSWAADLGTFPAAWVLAVALIAWWAPTPAAAAVRAGVFFGGMTVAYYAWAASVLDFGWDVRLLVAWLLLSATAVPLTGAVLAAATRRAGPVAGALLGVPAGLVLGSGAARVEWLRWVQPDVVLPTRPVQVVAEVVTAVVLVAVLPRHHGTRWWAAGCAVVAVPLAPHALDLLHRFV